MASVEKLREKADAARARLAAAEARQREKDRKRRAHAAIVVGSLMLERPSLFGLDAAALRLVLDGVVTRDHDRRALGLGVRGDA